MNLGITGSLLICVWLAVCAGYDLKSRSVPAWLTLPGLFLALFYQEARGELALVAFVALVFVLTDVPRWSQGLLSLLLTALFVLALLTSADPVAAELSMLATLALWLSWKLGVLGGADAQVLITLILFCGPAVLVPVVFLNGLQGLAGLLLKRPTFPAMLSILAGTGVFLLSQVQS
jgi:Flp pilus assembly protein protease CpaA